MLKVVKNEEGYIVKGFFKAFKENFKKSTIIWLILLVIGGSWGRFISDEFGQRFCGNGVKSDLCSTGTAGTCSRDLCICTDREI